MSSPMGGWYGAFAIEAPILPNGQTFFGNQPWKSGRTVGELDEHEVFDHALKATLHFKRLILWLLDAYDSDLSLEDWDQLFEVAQYCVLTMSANDQLIKFMSRDFVVGNTRYYLLPVTEGAI